MGRAQGSALRFVCLRRGLTLSQECLMVEAEAVRGVVEAEQRQGVARMNGQGKGRMRDDAAALVTPQDHSPHLTATRCSAASALLLRNEFSSARASAESSDRPSEGSPSPLVAVRLVFRERRTT